MCQMRKTKREASFDMTLKLETTNQTNINVIDQPNELIS